MRWVAALATMALLLGGQAFAQAESTPAPQPAPEAAQPEAAQPQPAQPETKELTASPAEATPATEAAPEAKPEAKSEAAADAPSDLERIIVAGAAGAVAVAGLAVGITFGVLAMGEYNCLKDVVSCNASRAEGDKIEGTKYLDARAEVERKALYADMGYLVAATAATVAIVGTVELLLGSGKESAE